MEYLIESDKPINSDVKKTFYTGDFDNSNLLIYKLTDEELGSYYYDVLDEEEYYAGSGKFVSQDGLFELEINENPNTNIVIKRINITQDKIFDLDNFNIEVVDLGEEPVIGLRDILLFLKDYTNFIKDRFETEIMIYRWLRGDF